MNKDRLAAFSDAVLAIIMTIIVLELGLPKVINMNGFWEMRHQFLSYALSFFWLGTMWVNLHNEWHHVKVISKSVVWWNIILLFFSSLIPYTVKIVNDNFFNFTAQFIYGIDVLCVTVVNICMNHALEKADSQISDLIKPRRFFLVIDVIIKIVGLAVSFIFPPAVMISVFVTMVFILITSNIQFKKG